MKIQFHRIDTNVVVGLLVREFCCSGTDVSAKVLAMYADTRTPSMEPQWLAAGLSQQQASKVEHIEILPESFLRRLKNAIRAGNCDEADEVIDEICSKLKSGNHSLLSFRVLYNDILHILITEWNDTHVDFSNIYNVFLLSQCLTVQQFSDILHEVCHSLIEARQTNNDDKSDEPDMASKAVAYMKENYSSPDLTMAGNSFAPSGLQNFAKMRCLLIFLSKEQKSI